MLQNQMKKILKALGWDVYLTRSIHQNCSFRLPFVFFSVDATWSFWAALQLFRKYKKIARWLDRLCSKIVISNVFSGMIIKQLIETESSITPAADISFKTWVISPPRSCSNHAIYLRWHATLLRDTRKINYHAHIPRKFASILINTDHWPKLLNESYLEY